MDVSRIEKLADPKQKLDEYKRALGLCKTSTEFESVISSGVADSTPLTVARPVLQHLSTLLPNLQPDILKSVSRFALEAIRPRLVSFQEENIILRENLANRLQDDEEWKQCAQILIGIPLDTGSRSLDEAYKLNHYVRIAQLFLEDDDHIQAETYINRASQLVHPGIDPLTSMKYKACFARIHDCKRRFFEAAVKYYELSQLVADDEGESQLALQSATVCTILSPAGPKRSRMLATLHKDERTRKLGLLYTVLEKMHMERILRPEEVTQLRQYLRPHHEALLADGQTVLDRAVTQHNLLAASTLYYNITFAELGSLLGITAEAAERVAARMIAEDRMVGSIDQIESLIVFQNAGEVMTQWDTQIAKACAQVAGICDEIIRRHPEYTISEA